MSAVGQVASDEVVARVAALDIGKSEIVACIRVPGGKHSRRQEVRKFATFTQSLLEMADWFASLGITRVVMESTSDYWKPAFYVLEGRFETWLVNARDVKHLPGRPKTDTLDAVWLCKVAERGMVRPCFIPDPPIRQLRDYTRYRASLIIERTAEKQRVEKLLEDAQIKISIVATDIFGVSGRAMLDALVAGVEDPMVMADLAKGQLRKKRALLHQALTGRFDDHHRFLLSTMLGRIDALTTTIAKCDAKIEEALRPFKGDRARLCQIPGISQTAAAAILAEIGVDMSRFPTPGHLASWVGFTPVVKQSAGHTASAQTGNGNHYLRRTLGEAAVAAGRTHTHLGERYRRLARRRGTKKALVATARVLLVIIWHLLHDHTDYHDLGEDYHLRRQDRDRTTRRYVQQLTALGYRVTLEPAA